MNKMKQNIELTKKALKNNDKNGDFYLYLSKELVMNNWKAYEIYFNQKKLGE